MSKFIYLLLFFSFSCLAEDIFINKQLQAVGLQCSENKSYAKDISEEFVDSTDEDWRLTNHEAPALRVISKSKRVGIWGDSHTASMDFINSALKYWGLKPTQVGFGLIQPALTVAGVKLPFSKSCLSSGWQYHYAHKSSSSDTAYSQSLLQISSDKTDSLLWLDLRSDQLKNKVNALSFNYKSLNKDDALQLSVSINNSPDKLVSLNANYSFFTITSNSFIQTVRVRLVSGDLGINYIEPVYAKEPEILVDLFSTPGALSKGWSNKLSYTTFAPIRYDLVIFEYGTNEGVDPNFSAQTYRDSLISNLSSFRHFVSTPNCVLVGPPDRYGSHQGLVSNFNEVHRQINAVQNKVALNYHCTHWNWQEKMGGVGSIKKWRANTPPFAKEDLVHLTTFGYQYSGYLFAKSTPLTR
jgi:hypothetical protein